MPRELITLQVGQAGNQIGTRFWDLALREHASHSTRGNFTESMSSFFRNIDTRGSSHSDLSSINGPTPIRTLKARAVLVDMEEGVLSQLLKGHLGDLFDGKQLISDVSGSGNNWAHGARLYGPRYRDKLIDAVRRQAEECDALQSFLLLHSLGGGTGSGLGCYLLSQLEDEFPGVYRFATSVFPSEDDDVVTSPYNATLSAATLAAHADCVLSLENQALFNICSRLPQGAGLPASKTRVQTVDTASSAKARAFDAMNGLAAQMLLNLTAGVRFGGSLNVDLNEITTNLVPFPRLHFLVPSMSPLSLSRDVRELAGAPRTLDQVFSEVFQREFQFINSDVRKGTCLACALLMRGNIGISDATRNLERLQQYLPLAQWNPQAFKLGLCAVPAAGSSFSILSLANNTCMGSSLAVLHSRFRKLYKRRFYLHHYEEYMDVGEIAESAQSVADLVQQYDSLHRREEAPMRVLRPRPLGLSFT